MTEVFVEQPLAQDNHHCDAIESRASFWIYLENLKHPKLSTFRESIGINCVKLR